MEISKGMRKNACGVSTLTSKGKTAVDPKDKAEMLNNQFSSVFTREDSSNVPDLGESPYPEMPSIIVGEPGVRKLLSQLKTNKASGADGIPAVVLKNCAAELAPMLTFIIQQSIDSKEVPADWKEAIVSPIFKKGSRSDPANYRPVSLTAICCKVSEHIITSETLRHLDQNKILKDIQHGFRKKHSCETQLLITTHDIASILNNQSQVDVAVLDFAKAFDKVPHLRLLEKLRYYNLDANVIGWIKSFLSNRSQRVVVDGFQSEDAPVLSGVPQGTVLGPLLFLIFINDISEDLESIVRLFADDCVLYREIKSQADVEALQRDLDKLIKWSKSWGMEFNIDKCYLLSITLAKKRKISSEYTMDGKKVKPVQSTKYLGVTINNQLKWDEHVENVCGTASKLLGFLRRTLHKCPEDIKEKAYKSLVRPRLEYSSSVWDPYKQKHIDKVEMVQRQAARFVKNAPHRLKADQPSVTTMIKDLGWETLQSRRKNARLTMLYKITNELVAMPSHYHPRPQPHQRRGHPHQFLHHQPSVDAYKYAFLPRTIIDWNALPSQVFTAESVNSF